MSRIKGRAQGLPRHAAAARCAAIGALALAASAAIVPGARAAGAATAAAARAEVQAVRPQLDLPVTRIAAGMFFIEAQVAATHPQRQHGLMGRTDLGPFEGMLFVFDQPGTQCFWMKNTPLPLSIAFLADDGRIVNIADMKPFDDRTQHCSAEPVRLALEMNQGFFERRGLKAGTKLGGPAFRPQPGAR